MLPRHLRLPASVRSSHPIHFHYPFFQMLVWPNDLTVSRFAVSISKQVDKKASARNRYRRIVLAKVQDLFPSVPTGLDLRFSFKRTQVVEAVLSSMVQQALTDVIKRFGAKEKKT